MHLPWPFTTLDIGYRKSYRVTAENFAEAMSVVPQLLGEKFECCWEISPEQPRVVAVE